MRFWPTKRLALVVAKLVGNAQTSRSIYNNPHLTRYIVQRIEKESSMSEVLINLDQLISFDRFDHQ